MYNINVEDYDQVIFCGIGGSAVPGEIVKVLDFEKPVLTFRESLPNQIIPKNTNKKILCFIVSYSGNTKETIKLYKEAKKRKFKIIIVTSGGELAKKNEDTFIVPGGYIPREALVYLLEPVLRVLKILDKKSESLEKILDKLNQPNSNYISYSKKVAKRLRGKVPIIYSPSEKLKVISEIWKTLFNENSKVLAHSNYFPEIAHNEIEARMDESFQVILLSDKETRTIKRAKKIIKKPIEVKLKGKNLIEKIIYGIYFGDSVSKSLAEMQGVDYKETKRIKMLKQSRISNKK